MCGIAGMYAYGRADVGPGHELLVGMAHAMSHRGPDDQGIYLSPDRKLGFAFRRLAIIDLSAAGHQPMSNEDGTVWLVFNGEIYNHADHRAALEAKGHVYRGRSDSETIIHLYEEYGEDCVARLRGMFAFAIWDARRQVLFLARDRLGIKPLYYTFAQGVCLFASEIKAILACPQVPRAIDHEALAHYFTFMITPAPLTMFDGVRKLPAGYRMTVAADGSVREERYWDAIVRAQPQRSDEEYAERVRTMLEESVRMRMMSDVPIGVLLSGGLDSTLLGALMARESPAALNTFSVGFERYQAYNELDWARAVARRLGTNHREVVISHREALDYVPELVHSQDEPLADWVCIPLHFVSKLARDSGVTVVQVGEGADELFCGYPLYLASLRVQRLWPGLARVPQALWALGIRTGALIRNAGMRSGRKLERIMSMLRVGDGRFWGGAISIAGPDRERLLDTPFWRGRSRHRSCEVLDTIYGQMERVKPDADALERMIYFELKQRLPELLLMRVDKITMASSVEARVPYLDHHLVEFAMTIPMQAKIRARTTKAILKRAATGLVPERIINRPKQGFSAPVAEWFRSELAGEVRETLTNGQLVRRGYVNRAAVCDLVAQHQERRADRGVELWNLYNLDAWHSHWIG